MASRVPPRRPPSAASRLAGPQSTNTAAPSPENTAKPMRSAASSLDRVAKTAPARIAQHPSPAVTFYVQKRLALGSIRFGVNTRRPLAAIDDDPSLSTGADGELLLHKREAFFFADNVPVV